MRLALAVTWTLLSIASGLAACGGDEPSEPAASPGDAGETPAEAGDVPPDGGSEGGVSGAPRWEARADLPEPVQETAVVALRNRVWVLGGLTSDGASSRKVHVYDPRDDAWTTAPQLPVALHHANAAVVGEKIYVVGSLMGAGFAADGSTFVYDPDTDGWTSRTAMPAGTQRGSSMVAVVGERIVVAGGLRAGAAVAEVSVYDTVSDTWSELPSLPAPRDHGVGAAHGDLFFAIGGRTAAIDAHTARVDVLDLAAASPAWASRAPMPTSRAGAALAVLPAAGERGVSFVVAGGEGNAASATGTFDEVERYDPVADTWSVLPRLLAPRHGTGAAIVGDVFYLPGGGDRQGLAAVTSVDALVF